MTDADWLDEIEHDVRFGLTVLDDEMGKLIRLARRGLAAEEMAVALRRKGVHLGDPYESDWENHAAQALAAYEAATKEEN